MATLSNLGASNEFSRNEPQTRSGQPISGLGSKEDPFVSQTVKQTGLDRSISNLEDVIEGKDEFSKSLMNQFGVQASAQQAARKSAARQRGTLSGLSDSQQRVSEGMLSRDIATEQAQQQGQLASTLIERSDIAQQQIGALEMQREEKLETDARQKLADFEGVMDFTNDTDVQNWIQLGKEVHGEDWNPSYKDRQNAVWSARKAQYGSALSEHVTANAQDYLDEAGNYSSYTESDISPDGEGSGAVVWNNEVVGGLMEDAYNADTQGQSLYIDGNKDSGFTIEGEAWVNKQTKKFAQTEKEAQWDTHLQSIEAQYGPDSLEYEFALDNKNIYATGIDPMYVELPDGSVLLVDKNTGDTFGDTDISKTDQGYDDDTGMFWYKDGDGKYAKSSSGKTYKYVKTSDQDGRESYDRYTVSTDGSGNEVLDNKVTIDSKNVPGIKAGLAPESDPDSVDFRAPAGTDEFGIFEIDGKQYINDPNFETPQVFDSTYNFTDDTVAKFAHNEESLNSLSPEHQDAIKDYLVDNLGTYTSGIKKALLSNPSFLKMFREVNPQIDLVVHLGKLQRRVIRHLENRKRGKYAEVTYESIHDLI